MIQKLIKLYQIQMLAAREAFQKGSTKQAIQIYTSIIDSNGEYASQALLNRASAYYSSAEYELSLNDSERYIQKQKTPKVQGYMIYTSSLIKKKAILTQKEGKILERGKQEYPYHKGYLDALKILEQLQITQNEEEYMQRIFQKLLSVPTIRNYMTEESFLTKVEKMITNPSLASALIKMDGRLAQVQDIILMADA